VIAWVGGALPRPRSQDGEHRDPSSLSAECYKQYNWCPFFEESASSGLIRLHGDKTVQGPSHLARVGPGHEARISLLAFLPDFPTPVGDTLRNKQRDTQNEALFHRNHITGDNWSKKYHATRRPASQLLASKARKMSLQLKC